MLPKPNRKQLLCPEMQRDHIHSNLLEQIASMIYFQVQSCATLRMKMFLYVLDVGSATPHHKDSFRYMGMVFYRTLNMAKSAEHAARPFLASAYRKRRFVRGHALADRPHTSLWLAKTYVIPAGMYGSQVWGTVFLQAGREFSSLLSTLHLHFLKGTLGVKQSTTNWAVLQECGHEPCCNSTGFGQLSSFSIVCLIPTFFFGGFTATAPSRNLTDNKKKEEGGLKQRRKQEEAAQGDPEPPG